MSTQVNQYFIYGTLLPYKWHREWERITGKNFCDTYEKFMTDNAFTTEIKHIDGIMCLFDGRDGKYIIIGRVLKKTDDNNRYMASGKPIEVPLLRPEEEEKVMDSVVKHFGVNDVGFGYYFVTHYV
jgi:hypothetical protein